MPAIVSDRESSSAKAVCARYEIMDSQRAVLKGHCQEIAELVVPSRVGFISQTTPGSKANVSKIYDGTAPWACGELAAALHGLLTNPASRWFQLQTVVRELMDDPDMLLWLEDVEDDTYHVFASPQANFSSQAHELYLDLAGFGTAIMLIEETPGIGPGLRYCTLYLGQCVIAENAMGVVDTLSRKFKMTARVIAQRWKEAVSDFPDPVKKALLEEPFKEFTIIHEVRPREDAERDATSIMPLNKPFSSCYVIEECKYKLSEGGFDEFPYLVPRWTKMAGETYGRSPAMTALADIKMVNKMVETTLRAAQKIVDPPLLVPDDGFMLPVRTTPAGLNFFRTGLADNNMIRALETKGNPQLGLDMINATREQILRAFYQDRLKLQKEKVEMTRFEAEERAQENLRMMSPVTARIEYEFLNLVVERTIRIRAKQGFLRTPPATAGNRVSLKTEYVSPLARAQKSGEAFAVQQAINLMAPLAQADPTVLHNFDGDVIARSTPKWFGLPAKVLRSPEKVASIRKQAAAQRAAETEKVDMVQGARAAKDMAAAQKVV